MNKLSVSVVILLVAVFSFGCATQPRSYFIEARIYPLSVEETEKLKESEPANPDETGMTNTEYFNCELKITEVINSGVESESRNLICAPKLTFNKGQNANVTVSDDAGTSGITADVLLLDSEGNDVTNLEVKVKEKGNTVAHSKMTLETTSK